MLFIGTLSEKVPFSDAAEKSRFFDSSPVDPLVSTADSTMLRPAVSVTTGISMQVRHYPSDESGRRLWLNRDEQRRLRNHFDSPDKELMVRLGLHGLRAEEILSASAETVREVPDEPIWLCEIVESKRGNRDVPLRESLGQVLRYRRPDGVDVSSTRSLDRWVADARDELAAETGTDSWQWLTVHDLRRTWATERFYELAAAGVPIAEELVMSWGGWRQSSSGRETFRQHYLGPVPAHVTAGALEQSGWV